MKFLYSVAFLGLSAAAAHATTLQLVHFDELQGNQQLEKYYDPDNNFKLTADPGNVNFNSSTLCADSTNGGNGNCVLEGGQDQDWTWVHDSTADPDLNPLAKPAKDADVIPDENYNDDSDYFNPISFFFQLAGDGGSCIDDAGSPLPDCDNFLRIAFYDDYAAGDTLLWDLIWKAGSTANMQYLTFEDGTSAAGTPLDFSGGKGAGYYVDLTLFEEWGTWGTRFVLDSGADAQIRLDCFVFEHNSPTTQPYSGNACELGEVPVPGGLPLMASALGIIGVLTRRKWLKA